MIEYFIVGLVALMAAALTLFSGFGLGTILMPVLALFFPIPLAVAATAVVHLANNIFKAYLVGRGADWSVVVRFAVPAALMAMVGAAMLELFASTEPLLSYSLMDAGFEVSLVGLVIGAVIICFSLLDILPRFEKLAFDRRYLVPGGMLSGFFGGLSGNQGALRSAFLLKLGLDRDAFIATGTMSAIVVDIARLLIYGLAFYAVQFEQVSSEMGGMVLAAIACAFLGSFIGSRLMKKVTLRTVQLLVGGMLITLGAAMAIGLI